MNVKGVQNPNVIDLITHDSTTDQYALIMIEHRPWASADQLIELQTKINYYLDFILDGQMERKYPESAGKQVRVQLDSSFALDQNARDFIDLLKPKLRELGINFKVNILN
jgi:hypothetical protein